MSLNKEIKLNQTKPKSQALIIGNVWIKKKSNLEKTQTDRRQKTNHFFKLSNLLTHKKVNVPALIY